ncbi:MAG: nitroreductase family protein [Ignavibacteriae bacterium]|nr:nitroreductase family protein [Ignavibacteriota bacterium]NOG96858.1 nitroreductase family protein [Ignavibacteriota bacterium]
MEEAKHIPYKDFKEIPVDKMIYNSKEFLENVSRRRSIRNFSARQVPLEIINNCILAAGSAPSGANMQPWHFAVVSNSKTKTRIRAAAEEEEREFYSSRAPQEWLDALKPIGTDADKPFLVTAPYLIVIFEKRFENLPDGTKVKQYYTKESVGIATGILITALHLSGLATLTHTPSPMNFLNAILERPANEKPYLVLVAGYPADEATVPNIKRKSLSEIASFI